MFFLPRTRSLLAVSNHTRLAASAPQSIPRSSSAMHTSTTLRSVKGIHTTDTYSKDIDNTPAADNTVYRVDPDSDLVHKPHEPPSGQYSRAGTQTGEYSSVDVEKAPYEPKGGNKERYGSRMSWAADKGGETSGKDEGPEGKSSQGRK